MSEPTSAYMAARREWNERYGSYIARARQWRLVAMVSLCVAVVSVSGVVVLATQSRIVPYVVEVDGRGETVGVHRADELSGGTEALTRATLVRWVQDLRGVSSDATAQRRAIDRVYAHLSDGAPAATAVGEWYRANQPFERAASETVVVEVSQALRVSRDTWRIEWTERPRTRRGAALEAAQWTGTATVSRGGVSAEMLILNPTGLYVAEFDWSRDLRERAP